MNPDIVNAIEIDEQQVDVEAIMRQIRQHLAQTHGGPVVQPSEKPRAIMLEREVYDELYEANQEFDKGHVTPYLTPTRIPLVGGLWQGFRARLHALVMFYVDRAVDAQGRFNSHTVRVLNGIVRGIDLDQTPDRVERLERRVAELEWQLQAQQGAAEQAAQENA